MSIKVIAECRVREESLADEFLSAAKELVAKTNALDKGCISYMLYRDKAEPLRFMMLEEWEDEASLDAHTKAAHFAEYLPRMLGFCEPDNNGPVILDAVF